MQISIAGRSRFQAYSLVVLLMLASALIGALAALFVAPTRVAAPTEPVAAPDLAPVLAMPVQMNAASSLPERDELWQEQRDIRLYQRQTLITSPGTAEVRAAESQITVEQEMRELKQHQTATPSAIQAALGDRVASPAVTAYDRYRLLKEQEIE